jgi:hypothetical protein
MYAGRLGPLMADAERSRVRCSNIPLPEYSFTRFSTLQAEAESLAAAEYLPDRYDMN